MVNKNYRKGYAFENRLVNRLKAYKNCKFVARTAGSHSPFDVVAIIGNDLYLIQCKANKLTEGERLKIIHGLPDISKELNVKIQLHWRRNRKTIVNDV